MNQTELFLEPMSKYLVTYKGKSFECWFITGLFITSTYKSINPNDVRAVVKIATPKDLFK